MVYTVMKTDITVAALDITSFVTVKVIPMNNNQCHVKDSFLRSHQLLSYSLNSLSFTEHVCSLLFPPQPHTLSLNPLAHPSSVFTHILHWTTSLLWPTCLVHFKCNADKTKCGIKKIGTLKNQGIPYVMYQCQVGTNNTNEAQTSTTLS